MKFIDKSWLLPIIWAGGIAAFFGNVVLPALPQTTMVYLEKQDINGTPSNVRLIAKSGFFVNPLSEPHEFHIGARSALPAIAYWPYAAAWTVAGSTWLSANDQDYSQMGCGLVLRTKTIYYQNGGWATILTGIAGHDGPELDD